MIKMIKKCCKKIFGKFRKIFLKILQNPSKSIYPNSLSVGFLAVVFSGSMGGGQGYGDFGCAHFSLCFHSQNGSRVSKTEGFLGVDFFSV